MIAHITAGKRFWHKPKSATVGTAQTKLEESYDLEKAGIGKAKNLTKIRLRSPSTHT
jgi:hypothetical protein